jgi:hydrogenase maturation protein HypF
VQGVGFRPFVWQLATRLGLSGEVLNDAEGVLIRVAGGDLDAFEAALRAEAPPLARIDAVESRAASVPTGPGFVIAASGPQGARTRVTPDAATCPACLDEIAGGGRRHGYAFTNCTHCGPRFTILQTLPYDRAQTTMAGFALCPACAAEYADPADRRFHAQPIACPDCGPRLWFEAGGARPPGDAIALAAEMLAAGGIVAVKGLGGFHLACDATDPAAIARLRDRKRRPGKPFALMAPLDVIRRHARPDAAAAARLAAPAAPILLLPMSGAALPHGLAPGLDALGWMLPATPLHHLLCRAAGRPLVMTSGNLSGEPQVIGNAEARAKLAQIADGFLMHDRDIARRLDDSVERPTPRGPMVLRRGRGLVPATLNLPEGFAEAPEIVAYGGQLKAAICLIRDGQALLSHHLGDLDDALSLAEFETADADYAALFDHRPALAACDLHPGYRSSVHAAGKGLPLIEVQHHHAHLAACLGDNLWPLQRGPVAGVVLDGLGLGPDGTVWGGELLVGDYRGFTRRAWLAPAPLPGGDAAQREPWRNLLARLDAAGLGPLADRLLAEYPLAPVRQAVAAGVNAPLSSSAGRLFDAVAAALEIAPGGQSYEGEAAMRLEAMARRGAGTGAYPFDAGPPAIDPAPMFHALAADLAAGTAPETIAHRFHAGLARAVCAPARAAVESGAAQAVALTGGCFLNALLLDLCLAELAGLPVLTHRDVPAGDGGLAFGQALVAAASC